MFRFQWIPLTLDPQCSDDKVSTCLWIPSIGLTKNHGFLDPQCWDDKGSPCLRLLSACITIMHHHVLIWSLFFQTRHCGKTQLSYLQRHVCYSLNFALSSDVMFLKSLLSHFCVRKSQTNTGKWRVIWIMKVIRDYFVGVTEINRESAQTLNYECAHLLP